MTGFKFLIVISIFLVGCTASYDQRNMQTPSVKLDKSKGVLISVPEDAWYANKNYPNSGSMTAKALRGAFLEHASRVEITNSCHGEDCLSSIEENKFGYYVKPEIISWVDRATEWSGKSDKVTIHVIIFDAITKTEVARSSFTGKSKWATFGGDHPQDLLVIPTVEFVQSLYK